VNIICNPAKTYEIHVITIVATYGEDNDVITQEALLTVKNLGFYIATSTTTTTTTGA